MEMIKCSRIRFSSKTGLKRNLIVELGFPSTGEMEAQPLT